MASIFGAEVLGMETGEIILFFLMIQGIAFSVLSFLDFWQMRSGIRRR